MHTVIRPLLILVALFCVLPAWADQDQQPATAAAPVSAKESPAAGDAPESQSLKPAAASATKASDGKDATVARVPRGYKVREHNGETVYCRKSTPLGTRFPTEVCMTPAQYEESVLRDAGVREELTGKQKSYSTHN